MNIETKIAQLLKVAVWRLTYCETISSFAAKHNKKNFDPNSHTDNFYKNVCVSSFDDAILIIGSLIMKEADPRPISLWNWTPFATKNKTVLNSLKQLFNLKGLEDIRNQIVAHQDMNNPMNNFPDARIKAYIEPGYVETAQKILLDLITLFLTYTKEVGNPWDPNYFSNFDAKKQIDTVMELAKPTLTNNPVI